MAVTWVNYKQKVETAGYSQRLKAYRVSWAGNISFYVFNHSRHHTALVKILVSPDGQVWMDDGVEAEVKPGTLINLVPNYFSKYCTLAYRSECYCHPSDLDIWFQMTRPPASQCYGVGNDPS